MSKCRKSIVTLALSFLIAFCVALVPVKAMAATQYGEVYEWTGDLAFGIPTGILHLTNNYTQNELTDEGNINSEYVTSTYEGTLQAYLDMQGNDYGYLHGTLSFPITFSIDSANTTPYYVSVELENSEIDSVKTYCGYYYSNPYTTVVRVYINFENFKLHGSDIVPLNFKISYTCTNNANLNGVIGYKAVSASRDEWVGGLTVYTDLRDAPCYIGDNARQLQSITDSIVDFKNWNIATIREYGQGIIDNIQARFYDLSVNLSNWYNGLISNLNTNFDRLLNQNNDEHEETINGYQGTGTSDASSRFDQSAGELENVESDLTNITNSSIDNYTDTAFDTSVIASLGSSLVYVVTWFTNFWNMGGLFTSILNVGLALSVAFFILRLRGGS